jgi:hypothetical protein
VRISGNHCKKSNSAIVIKRKFNYVNAWHFSFQNVLYSRLLSKSVKIRICVTIILPVVLYEYETWSLTLREEHGLMVFENRVLRRVFVPRRYEVTRFEKAA